MSNKNRRYNTVYSASRRRISPQMRRKLTVSWVAIGLVVLGIYIMVTNYGYWFGTKTQDGISIDKQAVAAAVAAEPITTGEGVTVYIPSVAELNLSGPVTEPQMGLANPAENTYYMAYRLELDGEQFFQSKLYAPGQGVADGGQKFQFKPGTYDIQAVYRFYEQRGMLVFIDEVVRDITVTAP